MSLDIFNDFVPHAEIACDERSVDFSVHKSFYSFDYVSMFGDVARGIVDGKAAVRFLCRNDLFFLVHFIMGIKKANHPFIVNMCRMVSTGKQTGTVDVWAREHFKSTIITIGCTVKRILNNPECCTAIFSYKKGAAEKFLDAIRKVLESPALILAFPEILYENPSSQSPSWSLQGGIRVKRQSVSRKEHTVEAYGLIEGMPTGVHADHRIYDDVETDDLAQNPDQLERLFDAFEMSRNLGVDGGTEQIIGTYYSHHGLLVKLGEKLDIHGRNIYELRIIPATDDGTINGRPVLFSQEYLDGKKMDSTFNCMPPGTPILCDVGYRPIESIQQGDMVVTHSGRLRRVKRVFEHRYCGDLVKISTYGSSQYDLLLTPEHPIYTLVKRFRSKKDKVTGNVAAYRFQYDDSPYFCLPTQVKKKDALFFPLIQNSASDDFILSMQTPIESNCKPITDAKYMLSKDFWRFVGYWLSEGICYENGGYKKFVLSFSAYKDADIIEDCSRIIRTLFGRKPSFTNCDGAVNIIFTSTELAKTFEQFGSGSSGKRIPYWVELLPSELSYELYRGFLLGDGTTDSSGYEVITSINLDMLQSLQRILFRSNKLSAVSAPYLKKNSVIKGRSVNSKPFYRLIHTNKPQMSWFESGGVFMKIKNIDKTPYDGSVYNLEVEEDNSYVAGLYAVHNSQQLCNPSPVHSVKLKYEHFKIISRDKLPERRVKFIIVDPAGDKDVLSGTKSDSWAMLCVSIGMSKGELGLSDVYIEDGVVGQFALNTAIGAVCDLYRRSGRVSLLAVERVGQSSHYEHIRKALEDDYGVYLSLKKAGKYGGNLLLLSPSGRNKNYRIESALSFPLSNGRLHLVDDLDFLGKLRDECDKFPFFHTDALDALSYLYDILADASTPLLPCGTIVMENKVKIVRPPSPMCA